MAQYPGDRSPFHTKDPSKTNALFLTLVMVLAPAITGIVPFVSGTASATADGGPHPNLAFYDQWALDADGNGIDDALDRLIALGADQVVNVLVHFSDRPTDADVATLKADHGVQRAYLFKNFDTILVELHVSDVPSLLDHADVVALEKDLEAHPTNNVGTRAIRARASPGEPIVEGIDHANAVHETLGYRGQGMVVAIIDTGVDNNHESLDDLDDDPSTDDPKLVQKLSGLETLYAGVDTANAFTPVGCIDPQDDGAHGTHVAGTAIGTGGPSGQYMGVAPQAKLVDVDIADTSAAGRTLVSAMEVAIDWIISYNAGESCYGDPGDDTVDVTSMSFTSSASPANFINVAINRLVKTGVTFVTSAGNTGSDANTLTGGADGAIVVANADDRNTVVRSDDRINSGSSRGPRASDGDTDSLDELRPDVAAPGTSIMSALMHSQNQYVGFTGTSMAAPHVAGVAALMLQANPGLRPVNAGADVAMGDPGTVPVRDLMIKTADYDEAAAGSPPQVKEESARFGLPWNNAWGYGLVDAFLAVSLAEDLSGQLEVDAGGPYLGLVGEPITFTASVSGGTAPYQFSWDFGDGNAGTGATVDHTYETAGAFTATVTVVDAEGTSKSAPASVCVGADCQVPFAITYPSGGEALTGGTVEVRGTHTLGQSGATGNQVTFDDPQGDQALGFVVQTPAPVPLPYADIVNATVAEAGNDLHFTIEVDDLAQDMQGNAHATYYFNFEAATAPCTTATGDVPSNQYYVTASVRNNASAPAAFAPTFSYGCIDATRNGQGAISGSFDTEADTITMVIPKVLVGDPADGTDIQGLEVLAQGCLCLPLVGGLTPTYDTASTPLALVLGGGDSGTGAVEVAVDDPAFGNESLLAVTVDEAAGTWSSDWDISALSGEHTLYARQTDGSGNAVAEDTVNVLLNSGGVPVVDITSPTEDEVVSDVVTVEGTSGTGGGQANEAPTATLEATPLSGTAPLEVTFTADGTDPDGTVTSYTLDFGDDSSPDTAAADPDNATITHTYDTAGTFTATLCVTDDDEANDCTTLVIEVDEALPDGAVHQLYLAGDTPVGHVDRWSDTLQLGVGSLQLTTNAPSETYLQDAWVSSQAIGSGAQSSPYDAFWTYENPLSLDGHNAEVTFWASAVTGVDQSGHFEVALYADGQLLDETIVTVETLPAVPTRYVAELGPLTVDAQSNLTLNIDGQFTDAEAVFAIHYDHVNYPSNVVLRTPGAASDPVAFIAWTYNSVEGVGGFHTPVFVEGNLLRPSARSISVTQPDTFNVDMEIIDPSGDVVYQAQDLSLAEDGSAYRADGAYFDVTGPTGQWSARFTVTNDLDRSTTRVRTFQVVENPAAQSAGDPEVEDGPDGTPAPPQADIRSVDFDNNQTHLVATMTLADLLLPEGQLGASEDANAIWWDVSFTTDTDYIIEFTAAGGPDCALWTYDPNANQGTGAWSPTRPVGLTCTYNDQTDTIAMAVPLGEVGLLQDGAPTGTVTRTWAATWPNTFAAYTVPFDAAPADDSDLGDGPWGDDHHVGSNGTGDTTPPSFGGLETAVPGDGEVSLSWGPGSDDASSQLTYEVYATLSEANVFQASSLITETGSTSYVAGGLTNGETYHFGVRARDEAGNTDDNTVVLTATPTSSDAADDPRVEVRFDGGDWLNATGTDPWHIDFDTNTVPDGTLGIEARYFDGSTYSAVDLVNVTVANDAAGQPFITIDAPTEGASLELPTTLEGRFSTTGESVQLATSSLQGHLPLGVRIWGQDVWVQQTLRTPAYQELATLLGSMEGFLGTRPAPAGGGHVEVLLQEAAPTDAPATLNGFDLAYVENIQVETLERDLQPAEVIELADYEPGNNEPQDTHRPGPTNGIGPGTPYAMEWADGSSSGCTAAFVVQDPATGEVYLTTAGHCLLNGAAEATHTGPGSVTAISVCVADCSSNTLGLGTYVRFTRSDVDDLVPFARDNGIGGDFGLFELPDALHDEVRPWMNFWGGPTGAERPATGDTLVHFGYANGLGDTYATQARAGITFSTTDRAVGWAGAVAPGDSGSAVATAAVRDDQMLWGDGAAAVTTHIGIGRPGMWGTDFQAGLDWVQQNAGLSLQLVTEDETLGLTEEGTPEAVIGSPVDGDTLDASQTPQVDITGTATFATGTIAPGTERLTYWLHRDDCGGSNDNPHMDTALSAQSEGGDYCTNLFHPVGPGWEALLGEIAVSHPVQPAVKQDLPFDPERPIQATVHLSPTTSIDGNEAPPTVVRDIELRLETNGGATLVGSDRVTNEIVVERNTPINFTIDPQVAQVLAGDDLSAVLVVHHSVGPVAVNYGGDGASHVDIPLGVAAQDRVRVAVDDATLANGELPVTGPTSQGNWVAPWDISAESQGAHDLYAQAEQGTIVQPTPDHVGVTVQDGGVAGPTASFEATVNGLEASFTDTSTAGDALILQRQWDFGDGETSSMQHPTHTYAAAGTYNVTLTVSDANGNDDSVQQDVTASTTTSEWTVQVRVVDDAGTEVLPWRTAATASDGDKGTWGLPWDADVVGDHTVEARLVEVDTTRATDEVNITVLGDNRAPTADAGPAQAARELTEVTLTGTGSDPDGDALTLSWAQTGGPAASFTTNPVDASTLEALVQLPDVDGDSTLTFAFTATDPDNATANDTVTITVDDFDRLGVETVNGQAPDGLDQPLSGNVSVAGSSSLATEGTPNAAPDAIISDLRVQGLRITATGGESTDADDDTLSYGWALSDGTTLEGPDLDHTFAQAGTYTITLTVADPRGSNDQAARTVTVQQTQLAGLVADAGDSGFARQGHSITLSGQAFNAQGATSFTWDLSALGSGSVTGQALEVDTTGVAPGSYTVGLTVTDESGATADDTVPVLVAETTTTSQQFENDVLVAVNDEDVGGSGSVDGATFEHTIQVPPGATQLHATLDWETFVPVVPDNPVGLAGGPNDFDLYVHSPNGEQDDSSADFAAPEEVTIEAPNPGTWILEVRSYLVVDDRYTLDVDVTAAEASPVPVPEQVSNVCFGTPAQVLEAAATSPADPTGETLTGAWDTDLDGRFDDGTGFSTTTDFPVDGEAHLVRFRAQDPSGFRATILVALRVDQDCSTAPSVVVVGVADSGINPYSKEFAGEHVPYAALKALTTVDTDQPGQGDVVARHALTDEVLPFTRHPSTYIPGFPDDAEPINLTLGGGYYKAQDDAAVWDQGHAAIELGQWYWFPGTKIIGAIDTSDGSAINAAPDATPIYDDDGHGTGAASVAVGNTIGACPRCVLVFAEGTSGDSAFHDKPWIDFVSVSIGSAGNLGQPDGGLFGFEDDTKAAAERGQTISYAAGNGNANAFLTPQQTYLSNRLGPDWTINVGATQKFNDGTSGAVLGTGKPVDWSSFGAGNIPSACRNTYTARCGFGGTSAATPISTGYMAQTLLTTRETIGDHDAGQKTSAQANGQLQAVSVGQPVADSPWLEDGVLQRAELWNVVFHCATPLANAIGFPGLGPASPVDHTYTGYGVADQAMAHCATAALLGQGSTTPNPSADLFFEADEAIRDRLWGDWDGDGDGQTGGNHNNGATAQLPGLPSDLSPEDVATSDQAIEHLRSIYTAMGIESLAPPPQETYYLHRNGCGSDQDNSQYMDHTPATDQEGGHGCASIASTAYSESWTSSESSLNAYGQGSSVTAVVQAFGLTPRVGVTMDAQLYADGKLVGSGTSEPRDIVSVALVTTPCTEFVIEMETTEPIPEDAVLTLEASTDVQEGNMASCYEGGPNASRVLLQGSGEAAADLPQAAIQSPIDGAELDPSQTPRVDVSGVAAFPADGAAETTTAYLRYDAPAEGQCGDRRLNLSDGPDLGNGCSNLQQPAGALLGYVASYPADFGPVELVPGAHVTGQVSFRAFGPSVSQGLFVLRGDGDVLGSQPYSFVNPGPQNVHTVDVDLPLDGVSLGQLVTSLSFEVHYDTASPVEWIEHEDPASYIQLPTPSDPERTVEVAIDDVTFQSNTLDVTGTDSWSAPWDLTAVAPGAHTIYARAVQDGQAGPASSVAVQVVDDAGERTGAVELAAVPAGAPFGQSDWAPASYDPTTGEWTTSLDTTQLMNGDWTIAARLLANGQETVRDTFIASLENQGRAPIVDAIDDQTLTENETLEVAVTARDLDLDGLTLSAAGLPAGATLTDHGDGSGTLTWTPSYTSAGTYLLTVTATDDTGDAGSASFQVTVEDVPRPPTLDPIDDQAVAKGQYVEVPVTATQPDPDEQVTLAAQALPGNATFTDHGDATGTFAWQTTVDDVGTYNITVTASDPDGSDTETFQVRVMDTAPTAIIVRTGFGYATVQEAIDTAQPGDMVLVTPGTHAETLTIPAGLDGLTLCQANAALDGCGQTNEAIIDGSAGDTVLTVEADQVTVSGLTLQWLGAPTTDVVGVELLADGPHLHNNTIRLQGGGCSPTDITGGCYQPARTTGVLAPSPVADARIVDNEVRADEVADDGTIGGTDGVRGQLDTGLVRGNYLTGWASSAAVVWGQGLHVDQNTFRINGDGVLACSGSFDQTMNVSRNEFLLNQYAVALTRCGGNGTGVQVVDNQMGATNPTALWFKENVQGLRLNAECNDWGVYHGVLIPSRIQDDGTDNEVDHSPYTGVANSGGLECLVAPSAAFEWSPSHVNRTVTVQFEDQSEQGSRPIIAWSWSFGDGNTSDEQEPTHQYERVGIYEVRLTVTDIDGMISTRVKTLEVANEPPTLAPMDNVVQPHTRDVMVQMEAEDDESDPLTYSVEPLPTGASMDEGTGLFQWDPAPSQYGEHWLNFTVEDGYDATTQAVMVRVVNNAPVIEPVGTKATRENISLTFDVVATDAEGDAIELTANGLPANATFESDGGMGTFAWTPAIGEAGSYNVTFNATSAGPLTDEVTVPIHVGTFNAPPEILLDVGQTLEARPGEEVFINAQASDQDNATGDLSWTVVHAPDVSGVTVSHPTPDTAVWTWVADPVKADEVQVTFQVTDGINTVTIGTLVDVLQSPVSTIYHPEDVAASTFSNRLVVDSPVNLRGFARDADGSVVSATFYPEGLDGPAIVATSPAPRFYIAPYTYTQTGTFEAVLEVTDDDGLVSRNTRVLNVVTNTAPTVDAGSDVLMEATSPAGATVQLSGSATDPDARGIDAGSYTWTLPGGQTLPGRQIDHPFPVGTHTVTLTVADVHGGLGQDTVTVVVDDYITAQASLPNASHQTDDGVYVLDRPEAFAGGRIQGNLTVVDDQGAAVPNASFVGTVTYYGTERNSEGLNVGTVNGSTDANGSATLGHDHELLTLVGGDGLLSAPGYHEIEIAVAADSRPGAPADGASLEVAGLVLRYWIGPAPAGTL